jgi:hypothetical protein
MQVRFKQRMMKMIKTPWTIIMISMILCFPAYAAQSIDMDEVRRLAELSVDRILEDSPVETLDTEKYWNKVHGIGKPLVVFFYSNYDGPSQRLATLIRYVAPYYQDKMSFAGVKVVEKGKPDKKTANRLDSMFSLDKTPGILFYDNVGTDMVLEDEDYIDPDFKEFRTPRMFLWKKYYSAVRKELDQLLAD